MMILYGPQPAQSQLIATWKQREEQLRDQLAGRSSDTWSWLWQIRLRICRFLIQRYSSDDQGTEPGANEPQSSVSVPPRLCESAEPFAALHIDRRIESSVQQELRANFQRRCHDALGRVGSCVAPARARSLRAADEHVRLVRERNAAYARRGATGPTVPAEVPPGEATATVGSVAAGLGLLLALLWVGGYWSAMPLGWWVLIDAVGVAIWLLLIAASVRLLGQRRPGWLLHAIWAACHVIWVPLAVVISPVVSAPPTPVIVMLLAMSTGPYGFLPGVLMGLGYWLGLPLLLLVMLWFAQRAALARVSNESPVS